MSRSLALLFRIGRKKQPAIDLTASMSVLVIKPCSIGDVLLATPLFRALRVALPNSTLALAVGTWSKVAVANNPAIDEIIDCGEIGTPRKYEFGAYLALAGRLRSRAFDVAFVADRSPMMTLLPLLAGIPIRIGLDSKGRGFSLTTKVPVSEVRHETEIYLDVARHAGISADDVSPKFHPAPDDVVTAERVLEEWGLRGGALLVVAPGGGSNPGGSNPSKRWDPACFAETADRLQDGLGTRTVIVGQESDAGPAWEMRNLMRHDAVNLVGQTSFGQLGAILTFASVFLGNDSAPSHLAAAVGTPTVTVFLGTSLNQYRPLAPAAVAVLAGDNRETISDVVEAVKGLIEKWGVAGSGMRSDAGS